jgi:hypothetical protein
MDADSFGLRMRASGDHPQERDGNEKATGMSLASNSCFRVIAPP